jgi:hypothetical protein
MGGESIDVSGAVRSEYIKALHAADAGKFEPLVGFCQKENWRE